MANMQYAMGSPYGNSPGQARKVLKNNYAQGIPTQFQSWDDMRGPIENAPQTTLASGSLEITKQFWASNYAEKLTTDSPIAINSDNALHQVVYLSHIDAASGMPIEEGFNQRKSVALYTAPMVNYILSSLDLLAARFEAKMADATFAAKAANAIRKLEEPGEVADRYSLMHGIISSIANEIQYHNKYVDPRMFTYAYCARALRKLFWSAGVYVSNDTNNDGLVTLIVGGKSWELYGAYPGVLGTTLNSLVGSVIKRQWAQGYTTLGPYRLVMWSSQGINMPPPPMLLTSRDYFGRVEEAFFDLHAKCIEPAKRADDAVQHLTQEECAKMTGEANGDTEQAAIQFAEGRLNVQVMVKWTPPGTRRY